MYNGLYILGRPALSHIIYYNPDNKCVFLRIEGLVKLDRIRKIAPEVASMCKKTGCHRLLNDMSVAKIEIPTIELFESPQIMDESGILRTLKRALVVSPDFEESRFLENVSRNRCHNLTVFYDIEKAKKWLMAS